MAANLSAAGARIAMAGPAFHRATVFLMSFLMFIISITVVVVGFIGYYSRVSLISEFQAPNQSIDFVFRRAEQIDADEIELQKQRDDLIKLHVAIDLTHASAQTKGYASQEYADYLEAIGAITSLLYEARELLDDAYWKNVNSINIRSPNLTHAQLLGNPLHRTEASAEDRTKLYSQLAPLMLKLRLNIVAYMAKHGDVNVTASMDGSEKAIEARIREILVRNPQWASTQDIEKFELKEKPDPEVERKIAEQRAIVKTYRDTLGWASIVLRAPTIVSTLLVTIATGWLGGLISFMGATARTGRPDGSTGAMIEPELISLLRRSILGITAALGIFLFAGSGLLVLSAQTAKSGLTGSSIELSPYFVAFLAFISGFLADDAFQRLTKAGRGILNTNGAKTGSRQAAGKAKAGRATAAAGRGRRRGSGVTA